MKKPRRRYAPFLLALLCVVLAAAVYDEADRPAVVPSTVEPPPHRLPEASPAAAFSLPPLRSYGEVVARPLFSPTRRPSTAAAAAADSEAAAFTLIGIVISTHDRHALVEHGKPPRLARLAEGQSVDGWMLEAIKTDRLLFRRGASILEVKAKNGPAPSPAPRPAAGAAAASTMPVGGSTTRFSEKRAPRP